MNDAPTTPTTADTSREQRIGSLVLARARELGWTDDGEGATEFLMRQAYEQGREDQRNGR